MAIRFFAGAGATGDVVAQGGATVAIAKDGTGVGTISMANAVASVQVIPGQAVPADASVALAFTARDAGGALVAVSPGSALWEQLDGAGALSVSRAGDAAWVATGTANVRVTVDEVTSAPTAVIAASAPLASIAVDPGQSIPFGATKALTLTAKDSKGVVISLAAVTWEIVDGGDVIALTPAGVATALKAGTAHVRAASGGVTSPAQAVTVSDAPLASLVVTPDQTVPYAGNRQLTFTATDANGGAVNVPSGGAVWSVVSGGANLSVTPAGFATALHAGPATVKVTVGAVSSAAAVVTVESAPLASLTVTPGQSLSVGGVKTLTFTAKNADGDEVTPGSYEWSIVSGGEFLSLNAGGQANGLSAGTATVKVTSGLVSATGTVVVTPQVLSVGLDTTDLAYDAVRGRIYAATNGQVVPVDPDTAALGSSIDPGNSALVLAVSTDGGHLYVGGANGTVVRIALPSGAVQGSVALPAGAYPVQMVALPNQPDAYVLTYADAPGNPSSPGRAIVFDGLTPRAATVPMGQSIALSGDGTRLYGYQRFSTSSSQYYTATVGSTGLTSGTASVTDIQGYGNRIHWSSGRIVADDGTIADPATGSALAHLTLTTVDHVFGTVPGSSRIYAAAWDPKQVQAFDILTTASFGSVSLGPVSGGLETTTWCGPNRVAIRSFSGSPNVVLVAGGLP